MMSSQEEEPRESNDADGATSHSHAGVAVLQVIFYLLSLVAAFALGSPAWLLVILFYCGIYRSALAGQHTYPRTLWTIALFFLGCSLLANIAVNLIRVPAANEILWGRLKLLWMLLGVQRWDGTQLFSTVVFPLVACIVLGAYVVFVRHVYASGLRLRRPFYARRPPHEAVHAEAAVGEEPSLCAQWLSQRFACCFRTAPLLLSLCGWSVAWTAPPSGVGLCLELMSFVLMGATLYVLYRRQTLVLSSSRSDQHDCQERTCPTAVLRLFRDVLGHTVSAMLVLVCATHNLAFAPLEESYDAACAQLGLGRISLLCVEGVRRAVQLLGMAVLVAGVAGMEQFDPMTRVSRTVSETTALLAVVVEHETEEEEGQDEAGTTATRAARRARALDGGDTPPLPPPQTQAEGHAEGRGQRRALIVQEATGASSAPSLSAWARMRHRVLHSARLSEVVVIVCLMLLLLHAVYFPSLVSLAVWLLHLCGCAGGMLRQPTQPKPALRGVLVGCVMLLSCTILVQYIALILHVNPQTMAWAWQPAMPAYATDGRAIAAQAISEHLIALLLGCYVSLQGVSHTIVGAAANVEAGATEPTTAAASSRREVRAARTTENRFSSNDDGENDSNEDGEEEEDSADTPPTSWMVSQLREAGGDKRELRKTFEIAVGRSPRSSELKPLTAAARRVSALSFSTVSHLSALEVFHLIASGPLYTYAVIISLFVLGTSSALMDFLHASCLVLSLLYSAVGGSAVMHRRLRTLPPVWVAVMAGLQLGYRVLWSRGAEHDSASSSSSSASSSCAAAPPYASTTTTTILSSESGVASWEYFGGFSALFWREAAPYLAVQLVLLWCAGNAPHPLRDWTRVWQCLVFRCRWSHLFHIVHYAAGIAVLLWIVLVLPRSANIMVLVLLLFGTALLHCLQWHRVAYVWQRFLIVCYCGVVLLSMLLVEFAVLQPRVWRLLVALGCPSGAESACARDVGLPSHGSMWLTPFAIPWWLVIVLATAAGTPHELPPHLITSLSSLPSKGAVATMLAAWRRWSSRHRWWPQLQFDLLTLALLAVMTRVALEHPSLLTALYLVCPVTGVHPTWTFLVAAMHTALQCTYQFWFSPAWLDTQTFCGVSMAQWIGLWRATPSPATPVSHFTSLSPVPSTLDVATAPLIIGLLQALQQQQEPAMTASARPSALTSPPTSPFSPATVRSTVAPANSGGGDIRASSSSSTRLSRREEQQQHFLGCASRLHALRRACAGHLYVFLLLLLLHYTQRCVLGWLVALLLILVWWKADISKTSVLLPQRWLYRLCVLATALLTGSAYVLHWLHRRFPESDGPRQWPWLTGTAEGVNLFAACGVAAAACVALRWSSRSDETENERSRRRHREQPEQHLCRPPFISWLRQRLGRQGDANGNSSSVSRVSSLADLSAAQVEALLAEAEAFYADPTDTDNADQTERGRRRDPLSSTSPHVSDATAFVQLARLIPVVACGSVAVGATLSSVCLLSTALLSMGMMMALCHTRMQWSFWRWWRLLVLGYSVLPAAALLFGFPPVYKTVVALPPWVGLLVGLSADANRVSGEALRFTLWHILLFLLLWFQSVLYNHPPSAIQLLRLQYAEHQRGVVRHAALHQYLAARVTRATEEASRLDREIRAYLANLRGGDDMTNESFANEARDDPLSVMEGDNDGNDGGMLDRDNEPLNGVFEVPTMPTLPPREVHLSDPEPVVLLAPPLQPQLASLPPLNDTFRSTYSAIDDSPSVAASSAVPRDETGADDHGDEGENAEVAHAAPPPSPPWYLPMWRWWQQRCGTTLRSTCNMLAAHTYHPSEYRVSRVVYSGNHDNDNGDEEGVLAATTSGHAIASLWHLFRHTLFTAVQVVLRHTPMALLTSVLVNSLLTGCLWELLGLFYMVQVALAYHPYAPRTVYRCFGCYLLLGVVLKELAVLWLTFHTMNAAPAALAWVLLPLIKSGVRPWPDPAASRGTLRYDTLWMDVVTVAVLALHQRMCTIYGVYVAKRKEESGAAPSALHANNSSASSEAASLDLTRRSASRHSESLSFTQCRRRCSRVQSALCNYYKNVVAVPGVGEDWYTFYTSFDFLALLMLALTYSRITGNAKVSLQDNVQNNQLPGPMAVLLCMSILQLVVDRMLYVQRCMRLKAVANSACTLLYCFLYWWWRVTLAVAAPAAGNAYFSLKIIALVFSITQVCRGYPVHRRHDAFTTHPGSMFSYCCFMVYRAIPFLWEVRTLIDWTVYRTSLSFDEYLTLEDVYLCMYSCREQGLRKRSQGLRLGDPVPMQTKWLFGVSRLALILLALLCPLLYYSTYNPSTVSNRATQLNFQLSFFGAHTFFSSTVYDNATIPSDWWLWLARTRPTLASYGLAGAGQTVQLMEFTQCSGSLWMASPQAIRQVLHGLRAAAAGDTSSAYILQSMEMTRSASNTADTDAVPLVSRWPITQETAQDMVAILEQETGYTSTTTTTTSTTTTEAPALRDDGGDTNSSTTRRSESNSDGPSRITTAVLPFFYTPFTFNRASRLDTLPSDPRFPHRNRQNCTLELHHERDVALHTMVRYWCLQCQPLFPSGNVPSQRDSSPAEWRCLTGGEDCERFDYEDAGEESGNKQDTFATITSAAHVPPFMVILSDSVVVGLSFLRGIGIVALYTSFVLALGRLFRSMFANKMDDLIFENMVNPAVLENMVCCIGTAREYGDLRLEHSVYLELVDLLRTPDRLFRITGSLRSMYADAVQDDVFRLAAMRHRDRRRRSSMRSSSSRGNGEDVTRSPAPQARPRR